MCGRYYIAEEDQAEELRQIIDMICRKHNGDGSVKTAGEIFPSEKVPVITTSRAQKIIPFPMEWGYSTSDGNRLINARSETASQKTTFKTACSIGAALSQQAGTSNGIETNPGARSTQSALNRRTSSTWLVFIALNMKRPYSLS